MHEEVYRQGHRVELQEGPLALLVLSNGGQGVGAAASDLKTFLAACRLRVSLSMQLPQLPLPPSPTLPRNSFAGSFFSKAPDSLIRGLSLFAFFNLPLVRGSQSHPLLGFPLSTSVPRP